MFNNFHKGRKVFLTGHTGFKESWLALWLDMLGAEVKGYALKPRTGEDHFVIAGIEKIFDGGLVSEISYGCQNRGDWGV